MRGKSIAGRLKILTLFAEGAPPKKTERIEEGNNLNRLISPPRLTPAAAAAVALLISYASSFGNHYKDID